jgi:hypothetical protein
MRDDGSFRECGPESGQAPVSKSFLVGASTRIFPIWASTVARALYRPVPTLLYISTVELDFTGLLKTAEGPAVAAVQYLERTNEIHFKA